ncbi:MAG: PAS domain S-box protein [Elusimicrobiota bacterium]|nr:PAS domain S-box protein [Elusimicrobiota bacterium]
MRKPSRVKALTKTATNAGIKKAELLRQLHALDPKYLAITSASQDIIYSANMNGKIVYANPKVADYGYRPEDFHGRSMFDFAHPQDRGITIKAFNKALKAGRTLPMLSYRIRKKDGGYFFAEQRSGIVMSDGKPALITGVIRDVSEKLRAAAALKESEEMLRTIFETAKDAIFIKDLAGRYIKLNKACAAIFLLKPEAALGKTDADIFPPEVARAVTENDREVLSTGKTLTLSYEMALPSGKYYFNTVKTPLRNAGGKIIGVLGFARDISNIKKIESELAMVRALDAVSRKTRPMAHNFNNALTVITGYATMIDDELPGASPIKPEIAHIIKAAKRATGLTSELQDFAMDPKTERRGIL